MTTSIFPLLPEQVLGPVLFGEVNDLRAVFQYAVLECGSHTAQLNESSLADPGASSKDAQLWLSAFDMLLVVVLGPCDKSAYLSSIIEAASRSGQPVTIPSLHQLSVKVTRSSLPTRILVTWYNASDEAFSICSETKVVLTFYWNKDPSHSQKSSSGFASKVGLLQDGAKETAMMRIETPGLPPITHIMLLKESAIYLGTRSAHCGMVRVTAYLNAVPDAMEGGITSDNDLNSSLGTTLAEELGFGHALFKYQPEGTLGLPLDLQLELFGDDAGDTEFEDKQNYGYEEDDLYNWLTGNEKVKYFGKSRNDIRQELKQRYGVTLAGKKADMLERLATLDMKKHLHADDA
ncbi:hypothetical protein P154DRAFT_582438 [Amniculicola lignicola CBS 123094]|uniref:SAP domain-containing protein n=1 Tax=Amniculicola lignicola CBS 123094 TaxID=1392246 RepID=A0A6A5VY08_9PLEO|nr:hypothetical protein P154DRAFT_582438 [Amniculicola lignicola CBS 123094]